jgi:type IV secretion system protein VirB10
LAQKVAAASDPGTSVAHVLPDRNLIITKGTPIGTCTTESPIRTDVPGQVRCKLSNAVYSASGRVRLLDPGTYAVVETSEPLQRGMDRAFGVVTRLETPTGCIVDLKSPIADQIGTAGIDGEIDAHFWERIKGQVVIAMLDFATQTAALAASNALSNATTSGNSVSFNQFGRIGGNAGRGFESDANIPSTLSTPQARNLVIQAMTDIDMRGCYALRATGGRR